MKKQMETETLTSSKEDNDIISMYDAVIEGKLAKLPHGFWGNHEEEVQHRLKLCFRYVVLQKLKIKPQEIPFEVQQSFLIKYKLYSAVYKYQSKRLKELLNDIFPEIRYTDQDEYIINMYVAALEGKITHLPHGFWGDNEDDIQHRLELCIHYLVLQKLKIKPQEILSEVTSPFLMKYKLHYAYKRQSKRLTDLLFDVFPEIGHTDIINVKLPEIVSTDEDIINIYDAALEGKIGQWPNGFWRDKEVLQHRLKLCLRYVVLQKLNIKSHEILSKVKRPFLVKYKLYYAFQLQSKRLTDLLFDVFPEIGHTDEHVVNNILHGVESTDEEIINIYDAAIEGKIDKLPRNFWGNHEEEVQRRFKLCFRYVVLQKLKIAPQEILSEVTNPFLIRYKLDYVVYKRQSKRLSELLLDIFPEIRDQKEYVVNIILPEKESTDEDIINVYDAAIEGKLTQLPHGFWGNDEEEVQHRLKLCLRHVVLQKLNMKPQEIHSEVKRPFLIKYKLYYYAYRRQSKGLKELLSDTFPEIDN
ncbi:DUF4046 domain-containing protein [Paenibacillus polymyxa]|uniref:DUF4046 domain-containing protein n=1 Tax=Paenibacillus polymyxa (strain SC2) TaxID=886882 RepID=E3EKG2_PAEPS|nr:DUF4046 domain-containing protein [Paenibacillus polymyxa]ADO59794.2 hypothetical protein PPSC2_26190 [Paenibacillus polymyxa SC2]WPQ59971.1 DUF4046 domain-containing protein [Paenibacillus polymyxa]